jgi:hypothetical protein
MYHDCLKFTGIISCFQLSGLGFIALAIWMGTDTHLQAIAYGLLERYIEHDILYTQQVIGLSVVGVFLFGTGVLGMVTPFVRKRMLFIVVRHFLLHKRSLTI